MKYLDGYEHLSSIIKPVGYQLLIRMYQEREKIGEIYLPDVTKDADRASGLAGQVIAMGPETYTTRVSPATEEVTYFPSGPWCQVGDWVILSRLAGARFVIKENDKSIEYRLINDDAIIGVSANPEKLDRLRM